MTDNQQYGLIIAAMVLAMFACFAAGVSEHPGYHTPYPIEQRRAAHWNLPRWARGDYPQDGDAVK